MGTIAPSNANCAPWPASYARRTAASARPRLTPPPAAHARPSGPAGGDAALGGSTYRVSHPLIGEVAYADLPDLKRRRIHLALAIALEQHRPDDLERLAHHYRGAGSEADTSRALDMLLAAGERARGLYANEEAARYFAAALDLAREGRRTDVLPAILERLGEAWARIGENGAAISIGSEALAAYAAVGDARAVARLHHLLAFAEWDRGGFAQAQEHLQAGVGALAGVEPSPELLALYLARVTIAQRLGDVDGVTRTTAALLALNQQLPAHGAGPAARSAVEALLAQVRVHLSHGAFEAARAAGLRALATAEAADELFLAQIVHDQLCVWAWSVGAHDIARDHAEQSLALARRLGAPTLEIMPMARLGMVATMAGAWEEALGHNAAGLAQARRLEQPSGMAMALGWRAFLLALRGDLVAAAICFAEARSCAAGMALANYHPYFGDALAAALALEAGNPARIRAATARLAAHRAVRTGFPFGLAVLGEAHVRLGETTPALRVAEDLAGLASTGGAYLTALAARVEGLARATLGQEAPALAGLARAATLFAGLAIPFEAARARLEWADLAGSGALAAAAAEESLAVFERLGAWRYAEHARQVLRRLGGHPRPVRRPGVAGSPLSRRELEVARLAAAGLTMAQVGERLFLSPATAGTHLHRIYERLGLNSRVALARYLGEHGLL